MNERKSGVNQNTRWEIIEYKNYVENLIIEILWNKLETSRQVTTTRLNCTNYASSTSTTVGVLVLCKSFIIQNKCL